MEPWAFPKLHSDIRTASSHSPFYQHAQFEASLDVLAAADDDDGLGPRLRYRPVEEPPRRNEDGTINVRLESSCKLTDEEGFSFYVRGEEMPYDEDRYHEFKGYSRFSMPFPVLQTFFCSSSVLPRLL